tara:strand:- start:300 stop:641 length:342 start_codon:yes stop_codon:yes gene_type:complete
MDKTLKLLPVLFLIYSGCDDLFDPSVNLWGVDYSIENTTELYLLNSGLKGEIPSEIGNLTNLDLRSNQLRSLISDEICNQGDLSPNLSNNQLCPPYPSYIEGYVGRQDTSNCD